MEDNSQQLEIGVTVLQYLFIQDTLASSMAGRKISQVIFSAYGANTGQRAATVQITWHIHSSV